MVVRCPPAVFAKLCGKEARVGLEAAVPSILDLLVKIELLEERHRDAVLSRSRSQAGGHIVQQGAEMGYAPQGTMARALSPEWGVPPIDLARTPPGPAPPGLLPARTPPDGVLPPGALR